MQTPVWRTHLRQRPTKRGAHVVGLKAEAREDIVLAWSPQLALSGLRVRETPVEVPLANDLRFAARRQLFEGKLADCFQHAEPRMVLRESRPYHQTMLSQDLQLIQHRVGGELGI